MPNRRLGRIFDKYMMKVGEIMGNVPCSIYRPDYTLPDQSGELVATNKNYRFDTQARKYAEPDLPGVFFYDIYGDRTILKSGDIIIPDSDYSDTAPIVTFSQKGDLKAAMGIMTDQTGEIHDEYGKVLYTNVRYQWAGPTFPGVGLNDYVQDTTGIPRRKVAMYKRQGIGMNPAIVKNMRLVETGNDKIGPDLVQYRWRITDIVSYSVYTILTLGEDVG